MDRESSLSKSNISTLCLGYTKFRYGIIQIRTISIEAPNRNSQLDIYIKQLSSGYQFQLTIKISIQDLIYQNNIYIYFSFFENCESQEMENQISFSSISIHLYIYIYKMAGIRFGSKNNRISGQIQVSKHLFSLNYIFIIYYL